MDEMMKFPDISEYYKDKAKATSEEIGWIQGETWERNAEWLSALLRENGVKTVYEAGCASGLLARALPPDVAYVGVDNNPHFIDWARKRTGELPNRVFLLRDVRNFRWDGPTENVAGVCFSFLKHFSLEEWPLILKKVIGNLQHGAFTVQVADRSLDDGKDFHHVFVTLDQVKEAVKKAGHEIVSTREMNHWTVGEISEPVYELAVWTRKLPEALTGKQEDDHPGDEAPEPAGTLLVVDGIAIPFEGLHRFSLRWLADGGMTLYHEGKRVTKSWRLLARWTAEEDVSGASANTAT